MGRRKQPISLLSIIGDAELMCPYENRSYNGMFPATVSYNAMHRPMAEHEPPYGPSTMLTVISQTEATAQVWVSYARWFAGWLCQFSDKAPLMDNYIEWVENAMSPFVGETKVNIVAEVMTGMIEDGDPLVVMPVTRHLLDMPMFKAIPEMSTHTLVCLPIIIEPKNAYSEAIMVPSLCEWFELMTTDTPVPLHRLEDGDDEEDED